MRSALNDLAKAITAFAPEDGFHQTPVAGVHCVKYSKTTHPKKDHWRACLAIVAQGCKEVVLGRELYRCSEGQYTATPIGLPVTSRVAFATPGKPFLALLIDLNPIILSEVTAQQQPALVKGTNFAVRALFRGKASEKMLDGATRLARLFQVRDDAPVLGPLAVREILYHLLKDPEGSAIRQFVRAGSAMHKIAHAVHALRSDLDEEIDVSSLAKAANMSRSAFFKRFKEVTAMSPIQYQKRLRLHEARRMMVDEGETAERSAFRVGYKSASQFSREYSRAFGDSPSRDAARGARLPLASFGAESG